MTNLQRCGLTGLLLIMLAFSFQVRSAHAETAPTDQALASDKSAADREQLRALTNRADVREKLQAQGVGVEAAQARVDALTDAEVETVASRIDTLPAGGNLSQTDVMLILLIAILVAIAI